MPALNESRIGAAKPTEKPYKLFDERGLFLLVTPAGGRLWGLFLAGAASLLGYGTFLNLAPLEFGQVVGLYLATLFVVWQVINFVAFRALPTLPIVLGGSLVIAGGAIITFWKHA